MTPRAAAAPRLAAALLLATPLAACGRGEPRGSDSFAWSQPVPAGGWLRVRDLNGSIRVARAAGPEVRVSGTRRWRGRRPEAVRFLTAADGSGAAVCAVWGGAGGRCTTDGGYANARRGGSLLERLLFHRSSVSVDFVVALPPGVRLDASTVNGRVTVADAVGEVRARSVNGSVTVDARGGPVDASTVNGGVTARVADLAPGADVKLGTVNGSVAALVPPDLAGDLDLQTTNGRVTTELPVPSAGRADRRSLRATLGAGGRRVSLKTVNGSVRLERATPAGAPSPTGAGGAT